MSQTAKKSVLRAVVAVGVMLLLAVLAGCMKPQARDASGTSEDEAEKREEMSATFLIGTVEGKSEPGTMIDGFSIPKERVYHLTVCVKDRRTQEPVRGHRFEVSGGADTQSMKSDTSGCVHWNETIAFDFLAEEKYLSLKRTLKGEGMQSGARELKFAINPWNLNGKAQDVVDLKTGAVPAEFKAEESTETQKKNRQLAVGLEVLNAEGVNGAEGVSRRFSLYLSPQLLHEDLQHQQVTIVLKVARLMMRASVIEASTVGGVTRYSLVWHSNEALSVVREGERFKSEIPVRFTQSDTFSRFYLAVQVSPVRGPRELMPFEGMFELGAFREVMGGAGKLNVSLKASNINREFSYELALKDLEKASPDTTAQTMPVVATARADARQVVAPAAERSLKKLEPAVAVTIPPAPVSNSSSQGALAPSSNRSAAQPISGSAQALPGTRPAPANESATSAIAAPVPSLNSLPGMTKAASAAAAPAPAPLPAPQGPGSAKKRLGVFNIGIKDVVQSGVDQSSSMTRTVHFTTTACATDTTTGGKPATDVEFAVIKSDGSVEKTDGLRSDVKPGCFSWTDKITHKYYHKERYFFVPVVIRQESSGFEERKVLAVNPWGMNGTIGGDRDENPKLYEELNLRTAPPSRLVTDSFSFDALKHRSFEVDKFLSMKMVKKVQLKLGFQAQRHSSLNEGRTGFARALVNGTYLLKSVIYVSIQDPSGSTLEMISPMRGGGALVCVNEGKIVHEADFEIIDPRLMKARANFVFELYPIAEEKLPLEWKGQPCQDGRKNNLDLESLIDQDSGLVTPTFVGPIWILDEKGASGVRPTDQIAKAEVDDPDSSAISKQEKEVQEYMRSLAGVTVGQLLERHAALAKESHNQMASQATVLNLARAGNLEFVSINNEAKVLEQNPGLAENNLVLPVRGGAKSLVELFNLDLKSHSRMGGPRLTPFALKEPFTQEKLTEFTEGKRELDAAMASRLCLMLMMEMPKRLVPGQQLYDGGWLEGWKIGEWSKDLNEKSLAERCWRRLDSTDLIRPFIVERKLRVFDVERVRDEDYKGGRDMSFSVGTDISFGRSKSFSVGAGVEFGPSSLLGRLGAIPKKLTSVATGLGFDAGVSASWSSSSNLSEGSSVSSGRSLGVERVEIALRPKRYEICTVVRANPAFWDSEKDALDGLSEKISAEKKIEAFSRGILICTGTVSSEPLEVCERYYAFLLNWFDGTYLDPGDIRNHPWMVSLRGVGEYTQLISLVTAKKTSAMTDVVEQFDVSNMPLARLESAYNSHVNALALKGDMSLAKLQMAYSAHIRAIPGVYTWDPNLNPIAKTPIKNQ